MADAIETGLYLLTPTHVGTGQAVGAVDLPIARERHTGHPYLPATAIKGVARDLFGKDDKDPLRVQLFGPPPPQKGQDTDALVAGDLVFTDGHLVAFPVRSLSAAFYWVTCPLAVNRWSRLREAWKLAVPPGKLAEDRPSATFAPTGPLVLEDHVIEAGTLRPDPVLQAIAKVWVGLLPKGDAVAARLPNALVCVPDADFQHLVTVATPVNARVQLTSGKTTDQWTGEDGKTEKGNLWYEETLPPDCLFSVLVATRPSKQDALTRFRDGLKDGSRVQIGGNETVGQGMASWRTEAPAAGRS